MYKKERLYEYAIVWHPTEQERKDGKKAIILVDLTRVLAEDATIVQAIAARAIPEEYVSKMNQVEILIRL